MCIRDSLETEAGFADIQQVDRLPTGAAFDETAGLAQRCACLLYTSDAADQRSSVDLGGRRIIQKKTT